jgi:anthranilate synthase component 2
MILMIDNYDSFTYNLVQYLRQMAVEVQVARNDAVTVADIAQLAPDAIVLSPGPGRPEQAGICIETVRAFSGKVPILGVCLGHQSIGRAFGAQVVPAKQLMHGKTSQIESDALPLTGRVA